MDFTTFAVSFHIIFTLVHQLELKAIPSIYINHTDNKNKHYPAYQ